MPSSRYRASRGARRPSTAGSRAPRRAGPAACWWRGRSSRSSASRWGRGRERRVAPRRGQRRHAPRSSRRSPTVHPPCPPRPRVDRSGMRRARRGSPRLRSVGEGSQYGDGARGRTALSAPSARGYLLLRRGTRQRPGARRGGPGGGGLRGLRRSGALLGAAVGHGRGGHVRLDLGGRAGRRHDHRPPLLPPRPPDRTGRVRVGVPAARPEPVEPGRSPPRAGHRPARGRRGARDDPRSCPRSRPRGPAPSRGARRAVRGHGARGAVPFRRRDASRAAGARARGPRTSLDTGPRGAPDRCVDAVGRDRSGLLAVVHRYGRVPRGGPAGCPLDRLAVVGSRSSGSRSSGSPSSGDTPAGRARPGTTRQIPLPRRASTRSASDAGPVRQRSEAGPVGAVDAPGEPAPEGFAMPAVLGQSWARDPGTLRRLIAGLRRMT